LDEEDERDQILDEEAGRGERGMEDDSLRCELSSGRRRKEMVAERGEERGGVWVRSPPPSPSESPRGFYSACQERWKELPGLVAEWTRIRGLVGFQMAG
jgi:hypothetical protein